MKKDSKILETHLKFCCPAKQYYSHDENSLVNTFKILPRVIINKKGLKVHNIYESTINIINQGVYKRLLSYSTDSNDTTVQVYPTHLNNNFLQPDQSLQITVCIKPTSKFKINRRRHVFITSQHPNTIFSIPIIILSKDDHYNISLPSRITFPSTLVENFTYYEMIVYNKSAHKLSFNLKCALKNLTVHTKSCNVLKKDYGKILLKLYCKDLQIIDDCLKLKFNTGDTIVIPFRLEPLQSSLFVDTININFNSLRFNREETNEFFICNESNKDIVFHVDFILPEKTFLNCYQDIKSTHQKSDNASMDKLSFKHFEFKPKCATITAHSIYPVQITFRPVMHKEFLPCDDEFPPFNVMTYIVITWTHNEKTEERIIYLNGKIIGPEIEILPAVLDLRQIYFGEENCVEVQVINKDDICDAHVDFHGVTNEDTAQVVATPKEGLILKPQQCNMFEIKFYCTIIGRFLVTLNFKVKNGSRYLMIIRGYSHHVRVKCFPDIIELGVIPIAIPQKRLVLLMNPLAVPITVECTVRDDGNETPLVLDAPNVNEHLPITVNDPFYFINKSTKEENDLENDQVEEQKIKLQFTSEEPEISLLSVRSETEDNSSYSSEFEKLALDLIPDISFNFVSYLKTIKLFDKPEMEKKVIEEALSALFKTPYFFDMDKYKNYTLMDWNSLATDPKEIYCNTEIISLKPNTGKAISIVVIPNVVGCHHKYIEIRVCPSAQSVADCKETCDLRQIVETDFMISKLFIEYKCSIPEIIWDNVIIMQDLIYAGEFYDFEMLFQNISSVGGFFYYDVIPYSNLGIMKFSNNKWKYFIEPQSMIYVPCKVKFNKLGFISLSGLIKFIGAYACYPFHIKSEVLPPKVNINPRSLCENLHVCESKKLYIFIENATPTTTWFKLKLKDESCMSIEPSGGQLASNEQAMYVTLNVSFKDPGTYKNVLYIIMEFETVEKIPITINVEKIPILFEPEILAKNLNIGYILCNTDEDYRKDRPNFSKVIKVINKGLRSYRLTITRTKSSAKPSCGINSSKAKLTIKPNSLTVSPSSINCFNILINCCEETSIFSEFRLQLRDQNDVKHMESYRFSLLGTFIMPQLSWNRREIAMNYFRTHKHREHEQFETIKLANITQNYVNCVNLRVSGPFKIKELFEHKYEHELNFPMDGLETKELFIMLNKEEVRNRLNTFYEGSISCQVNLRVQKSVRLVLRVFVPQITLKQNVVTLFTKNVEGGTYIELINTGKVPAIYKWKKLREEWHYVSQEDDIQQVASLILSELLNMLELEAIHPESDSETNITRRYKKFKCILKEINDPINVKEILYDIIENLDLNAKRYKLSRYQTPRPLFNDLIINNQFKNLGSSYTNSNAHSIKTQIDEVFNMEIPQLQEQFEEKLNEIEDHFNSQSIYINRKFEVTCNTPTYAAEKFSSVENCVYYTLDDILGRLKLEDSYDNLSLPSSESCELRYSVYFFEKCGLVQKNQREMCALHIPPIRKGFEVRAIFQLDVVGGKSQVFDITLVNLDNSVTLKKEHIYLGVKPWYQRYHTQSFIQNTTSYLLSLKINQVRKDRTKVPKIASGFIHILNNKTLQLPPFQSSLIKTEGIMGFNEEFKRELIINVNDSEDLTLKLSGQGVMPMLIMSKPLLSLEQQQSYETIEEYCWLQKLYYFESFKTYTEKDENIINTMQEEEENNMHDIQNFSTDITLFSTESEKEFEIAGPSLKFFKLMQTYILVNYEDVPNSVILEQLLQTEKFLSHLRHNPETCSHLSRLYQNYLLHQKSLEDKIPINLKLFTIQPLPFQLRTYLIDMGKVSLNQYGKYHFTLEFLGPGELLAAIRTAIKIPGLTVDFEIFESEDSTNFIYYRVEDKLSSSCNKPYLNINERLLERETNPKVSHAHSYDFNTLQQHQRFVSAMERKCFKSHYNSLNKSVYLEQKYHFTQCKLWALSKSIYSKPKIHIIVLFRPQKSFYKPNQHVEDYLYIDLHMGPTLPVLLRAVIVDKNRKENS